MAGVHAPERPAAASGQVAFTPIRLVDEGPGPVGGADQAPDDPAELMLTCANCGARMDERKCKLICRCGYFLSCSDYY
jgi:hypothetical protein